MQDKYFTEVGREYLKKLERDSAALTYLKGALKENSKVEELVALRLIANATAFAEHHHP